jgi:hypothetical protein
MPIVLALLASVAAYQKRPGATPPVAPASTIGSSDAAFWRWFVAHKDEVATVRRADEPIADELAAQLHRIDPQLTFETRVWHDPSSRGRFRF